MRNSSKGRPTWSVLVRRLTSLGCNIIGLEVTIPQREACLISSKGIANDISSRHMMLSRCYAERHGTSPRDLLKQRGEISRLLHATEHAARGTKLNSFPFCDQDHARERHFWTFLSPLNRNDPMFGMKVRPFFLCPRRN